MIEIIKEENTQLVQLEMDENCFFGCTTCSLEVDTNEEEVE